MLAAQFYIQEPEVVLDEVSKSHHLNFIIVNNGASVNKFRIIGQFKVNLFDEFALQSIQGLLAFFRLSARNVKLLFP